MLFVYIDLSSESLLTCFKIIEHYCILGGTDFLQVWCLCTCIMCMLVCAACSVCVYV